MNYFYLHGFASSPQSRKAVYLRDRFHAHGLGLIIPDLNQDDFFHLTLTRQIQQVELYLQAGPTPFTLIGSSFGGLTAAWIAQRNPQVEQLILLAPAFGFLGHWLPRVEEVQIQQWQQRGELEIFHYGFNRMMPLSDQFVVDLKRYDQDELQRVVPTLILHGTEDETIPMQASRDFADDRTWVQLQELESDHGLANVLPEIWQAIWAKLDQERSG